MEPIDATHDLLAGIRALSFDLDDTFWDCAPAILQAEQALLGWFEQHAPRIVESSDRASRAAVRDAIVAAHPELACDVTALRRRIITALLATSGYDESLVEPAFTVFRQARSQVILYEGVVDLLSALPRYYRVAAITNGKADLHQIGIADSFELILAASLENTPKPAPDMFRKCIDKFRVEPHELLHIGDNADTDVGGAKTVGARAVWFNQHRAVWPSARAPAEFEVQSIAELSRLLLPQEILAQAGS